MYSPQHGQFAESNGTTTGGTDSHGHEQRRPELDRELYPGGIADDVLRDLYVRGKYRDVILPMTVLHRLDAVLEDSKP